MNYKIRLIKNNEIDLLNDFIYEAIFQRDENNFVSRDIIYKPDIWIYVEHFGSKPDDLCLVAECNGKICGAVWTRIIDAFGHVNDDTPEFAISLYKEYRGQGIGTAMMREMLNLLKEKGYNQTSFVITSYSIHYTKLYDIIKYSSSNSAVI